MGTLDGKVALVTGASRGIGRAIAQTLAQQGAIVVGTATSASGAQAIEHDLQTINTKCRGLLLNVADGAQTDEVMKQIEDEVGSIAILVNNAGIAPAKVPLAQLTKEQWKKTLDVNLMGSVNCTIAAVLAMQEKKQGVVISLSSMSGFTGGQAVAAPYACSKAAIECLTKAMAREYAALGIRVLAVAPGLIQTDMTTSFSYDSSTVPLQRMGTPEDVADVIVSISSDHFRYVTGTTIDINGGLLMR